MESSNIELIRSVYAAFTRGDIEFILARVSADVEWVDPGAPAIPFAGTYHGVDGAAQFFGKLGETVEVFAFEPRDYLVANDLVGVFGYWRGRAKQTNREFESDWAMSFRVRDGKVTRFQAYVDTAAEAAAHAAA